MSATYLLQTVSRIPSILELHLPSCQLSDRPLTLPFLNFTSLSVLDLSNNGFKSTIPDWLFNLRSLVKLDLSNNHFHGEIPDAISNLAFLERLDLSGNSIGGKLSRNLGKLCNLRSMELYDNKISGEIVDYFDSLSECFSNRLETLDLGDNGVMGKLPDALGYIKSLRVLRLSNNSLQRLLPCSVGNLKSLQKILLGDNRMSGRVLSSLSFNKHSSVYLLSNHFDGLFPLLSSNITTLYLSINQFLRPILDDIGEAMPLLSTLDISFKTLTRSIPLSIENLSKLTVFVISNNKLSGQVPQFWENLPFLEFIDMSNNSLFGTIPRSIGSLSHLQYLSIPSNNFSGELPSFRNYFKMVNIILSYNKFFGKLPVWIGSMSALLILRLKANFFTGNIPSKLCSLSNLHILDLSHNSELPSYLKNCTSLASLDLGDNKFSRKLPSWIGETMPNLLILRMRSNFFTGDIPLTFYSLANLHILDLSYNSLSGHMLDCIGILSGEIPKELIRLVKLVALNLSMNYLTGLLPTDIVNLKSLETHDLSNNKLFGPIPLSMPSLTFLSHLNLSYNTLSGKIPTANQFQTLGDPSIYQGNAGLFGKPLPTDCTGSIIDTLGEKEEEDGDIGDPLIEQLGFFISMFLGFFVGFWGVCGTLIIKRSWRDAYFHFVDRVKEHFVGKKRTKLNRKQH
ncbi:hypothetical protein FEM48_Zijuj09G0214700 [Ziziphus jujuba var. spinosa]|uniref:Uncharacterized protein n=1 Tax=Ziziphus jujuba var. spinosa TaxID=714518 RepID=A0A978UVE7_ZIZJJ|nr:hypothetical protein FEM48_Zijuj09G0214700 [Ziziphus jujuba var. spinosa]